MDKGSIFWLYENLNLSTQNVPSIYYVLYIIHYTTKKLNKIFFNNWRKIETINFGARTSMISLSYNQFKYKHTTEEESREIRIK